MFLAAAGLGSGSTFADALGTRDGLQLFLAGAVVACGFAALVPLVVHRDVLLLGALVINAFQVFRQPDRFLGVFLSTSLQIDDRQIVVRLAEFRIDLGRGQPLAFGVRHAAVSVQRASKREQYYERLRWECKTIIQMGFPGYFLIVQDFINWAKARGIPVGPGRGSAAGSLVAYCLRITDIDPLSFDLLFERFLNPDRVSMPDIDIDFCYERRGAVIEYVRQKYGRDSVGQIITFGTMKARAAFRDVARTLRVEMGEVDRLTKAIPSGPAVAWTLPEAAERTPELRAAVEQDDRIRKVVDVRERLVEAPVRYEEVDVERVPFERVADAWERQASGRAGRKLVLTL